MKVNATLLFLFFVIVGFSQRKIEKNLGSFDELKVFNGIYLTLEKSDAPRIIITGKKSEEVVIKNVNGRLKLSMNFPETFNAHDVKIEMYYSDILNTIDVNEGSSVTVNDTIKQHKIELKAQEGAMINASLNVQLLIIKSVSGGIISLNGIAAIQEVDLNTGGVYKGFDLISKQATVFSATGAYGRVYATDVLDAKVNFGGNIYYKGIPKDINTKKILGGTIKSID